MNKFLLYGAILGLASVIMGALGDHAFDLSADQAESLQTAIRYNMLYAVLICALSISVHKKSLKLPALLFSIGASLFAGSIYLALLTGISQLTYISPLGGLTIMTGWAALGIAALNIKKA